MLKSVIMKLLGSIDAGILSAGSSGLLTAGIGGLSATLYGYIKTIMSTVALPMAYVVLAVFMGLELYHIADRSLGEGSTGTLPLKLIFKLLLRLIVAKTLVDKGLLIMEAIYSAGQHLVTGISGILAAGPTTGVLDLTALTAVVDAMGLGEQIGMFFQVLLVWLVVFLATGAVQVICIGRFIEIYIMVALGPVPLATLLAGELSDIGKNFLKNFAALCLQGAILCIILSAFPILLNANILGTDPTNFLDMMLYALTLFITVFSSQRIAKSICHAI